MLLLTLTRPSILSFGTTEIGTTTKGPATTSVRFNHGTYDEEAGNRRYGRQSQNPVLSVGVHVERDMYDDDTPKSPSSPTSPYSQRRSGKTARSLVYPIRPPVAAYALQDLRDKENMKDADLKEPGDHEF